MSKANTARWHRNLTNRRLARCLGAVADLRNDRPHRVRAAREATRLAEMLGLLQRPPACECCGDDKPRLERHHWDYSQPLRVSYLCPDCHHLADAMLQRSGDNDASEPQRGRP